MNGDDADDGEGPKLNRWGILAGQLEVQCDDAGEKGEENEKKANAGDEEEQNQGEPHTSKVTTTSLTDWIIIKKVNKDINEATSSHTPTDSPGAMSPFEKQRIDQCIKIAHLVVGKLSKNVTTENKEGKGGAEKTEIISSSNSNEVEGDDYIIEEGVVSVTDWEPKPKEICEDCITVTGDAQTGDVVDVGFDIYQNFDWDDGIEDDVDEPSNDRQKLGLIFEALGKLFYRLFMQGEPVPPCPTSSESDLSLYNINDNDSSIPSEDDILESFRQLTSSGAVNKKNEHIASSMRTLGKLPVPICQLVEDLFDTAMAMQKGGAQEYESGDSCFTSLSDLYSEIQHMIDFPDALLYGTITSRWELVFDDNHMFGRENELKQLLDIANSIQPSEEKGLSSVLENIHPSCGKKNEVIMVKGYAGCGKTRLVNEIRKPLQTQGWLFLRCKFGKTSSQTEPLSVISIGFDEFFSSGVVCDTHAVDDTQDETATSTYNNECSNDNSCCPNKVLQKLENLIGVDGLKVLSQQMPSLRNLIEKTYTSDINGETTGRNFDVQHLFGALLDTLLSFCPVSFFVDDLQWADSASVELLTKIINRVNVDQDKSINRVLFVGTYRDGTITEEASLMQMIKQFEESNSVNVTQISLHGFNLESLNEMVSEALCIPQRKSKSLAQVIHLKTQGFPLFVVEFLDALWTEKLLVLDPMNGWEWDVDAIDLKGISSNVAELLSSKLSTLPPDFLKSLQVLSCFGSHVDVEVLEAVKCYDGSPGTSLMPSLLSAQNEGLIEKAGPTYTFTHDVIQQAAYSLIPESERMQFLQKLVSCLIPLCMEAGRSDNLLFVTVDLIDRIGSDAISGDPKLYAQLNLEAGEKYMKASDFSSAVRHFNSGISFLGETLWRDEYDLSLRLYESSALAYYSQGNHKKVASQVNKVLDNAKNFEDKFKSYCLFINVIAIGSVEKAIAKLYEHLQYLGEKINPNMISPPMVLSECISVRSLLSGNQKEIFLHLTRMTNQAKLRTMKLLSMLVMYSNQQKSLMGGYLACRMIRISVEYGHCEDTVYALAAFAAALVNQLNDTEEGYALAKTTLALMKYYDANKLIPRIYRITHGVVLIVKDPMQSLLDPLLQACRLSFTNGDHEHSTMNTVLYLSRCWHSGKKIPLLMNEISAFAQQHKQQNHLRILQLFLAPSYKTLSTISGIKLDPSDILVQLSSAGSEDIVETAMVKNEMVFVQIGIVSCLTQAFYCRDFNRASKIIVKYQNFFQMLQGQQMSILEFEAIFLAGLVSFHMARETRERFWMERGMNVLAVYSKWGVLNEWNFSHKFLLLKAELHYTNGETNAAIEAYDQAVKAAQNHSFVHQVALACELAARFYGNIGHTRCCKNMLQQSHDAYIEWGAALKAAAVLSLLDLKWMDVNNY